MTVKLIPIGLLAVAGHNVGAAQLPLASSGDSRIRYVDYNKDEVMVIRVRRGVATRIVLGADEKIIRDGSATGFPADCAKPELEWCMRADAGGNQILVKPRDNATHNNLELRTDKRDYSFQFDVLPEQARIARKKTAALPARPEPAMYRVIFRYPQPAPPDLGQLALALEKAATAQAVAANATPSPVMHLPVPKNWQYSMQVARGAEDITPALVFDDGRFTYFRFPANREVPTIYFVSSAGDEARVNFHIDPRESEFAVVERMGRRFILRLGTATVSVSNDAFDSYGVPPSDGTTIDGLVRSIRQ